MYLPFQIAIIKLVKRNGVILMKRWEVYLELMMEFIVAILFFVGILYVGPKLLGFLWPFVAGWLISILANPLRNFLEKKIKVPKKFGSALIIILALAIIVGLLYFLTGQLIHQVKSLINDLPFILDQIQIQLDKMNMWMEPRLQKFGLDVSFLTRGEQIYDTMMSTLTEWVKGIGGNSIQYAGGVAKGVTNGLVGSVVMILSAYFFLVEREEISVFCKKYAPQSVQEKVLLVKEHIFLALGGYVKAQIKIMGIIFVILFIGLALEGERYAFLLAVIISIWDVLPFLGTGMILIPWAIFKFVDQQFQAGVIFLILYLICLLARQLLQPKILGDSIGLRPLPTLFLIYVGLKLGGFMGFIFAMILGIVFHNFYKLGFFKPWMERVRKRVKLLKEIP